MVDENVQLESPVPILIISREHKLLPLAHRLRNIEHYPTEVAMWKESYERAWDGMIEKNVLSSKREIGKEFYVSTNERAKAGEVAVVYDAPAVEGKLDLEHASNVYPIVSRENSQLPIRLGFWWDGHVPTLPHLLIYDMGAWPGGLGRLVPGGLTLISLQDDNSRELWDALFGQEARDWLRGLNFKGLANVGLVEDKGTLVLSEWELGWPDLHTQAFMGALEVKWSELLFGKQEAWFPKTFTVALPLTVPPWPGTSNTTAQARGVRGVKVDLNEKLHQYLYWHDVEVNTEEKSLYVAGLDGLVGVVHSSANCFENAQQKVLAVAANVGLDEKQFRADVGSRVRLFEAQIEENFGVSL